MYACCKLLSQGRVPCHRTVDGCDASLFLCSFLKKKIYQSPICSQPTFTSTLCCINLKVDRKLCHSAGQQPATGDPCNFDLCFRRESFHQMKTAAAVQQKERRRSHGILSMLRHLQESGRRPHLSAMMHSQTLASCVRLLYTLNFSLTVPLNN